MPYTSKENKTKPWTELNVLLSDGLWLTFQFERYYLDVFNFLECQVGECSRPLRQHLQVEEFRNFRCLHIHPPSSRYVQYINSTCWSYSLSRFLRWSFISICSLLSSTSTSLWWVCLSFLYTSSWSLISSPCLLCSWCCRAIRFCGRMVANLSSSSRCCCNWKEKGKNVNFKWSRHWIF